MNEVSKIYWFFGKIFCMFEFCIFCAVQEGGSLSQMTRCLFYVSDAEQWNIFVFLVFFNIDLTFKNQECLSVTVFLKLSPYSSHSRLYLSSFFLAPTFIFVILIFSVIKLNDFSFLHFHHFFGLQLISFNIRQYWEFVRKSFPKFPSWFLLQFSSCLGFVFKRLILFFDYYSAAYVFSMIHLIFE